jgi:hypothetical protein
LDSISKLLEQNGFDSFVASLFTQDQESSLSNHKPVGVSEAIKSINKNK